MLLIVRKIIKLKSLFIYLINYVGLLKSFSNSCIKITKQDNGMVTGFGIWIGKWRKAKMYQARLIRFIHFHIPNIQIRLLPFSHSLSRLGSRLGHQDYSVKDEPSKKEYVQVHLLKIPYQKKTWYKNLRGLLKSQSQYQYQSQDENFLLHNYHKAKDEG